MKLLRYSIVCCCFIAISKTSFSQNSELLKTLKVDSFLPLDSILNVEIYNSWNGKKYSLSPKGLLKLKNILSKAKAQYMPILKPGHLSMKITFSNPNTLKSYEIYMYPEFMILDPDYLSKKPFYYIEFYKPVSWNSLND